MKILFIVLSFGLFTLTANARFYMDFEEKKYPNGLIVKTFSDGHTLRKYPDGHTTEHHLNGVIEIHYPNNMGGEVLRPNRVVSGVGGKSSVSGEVDKWKREADQWKNDYLLLKAKKDNCAPAVTPVARKEARPNLGEWSSSVEPIRNLGQWGGAGAIQ